MDKPVLWSQASVWECCLKASWMGLKSRSWVNKRQIVLKCGNYKGEQKSTSSPLNFRLKCSVSFLSFILMSHMRQSFFNQTLCRVLGAKIYLSISGVFVVVILMPKGTWVWKKKKITIQIWTLINSVSFNYTVLAVFCSSFTHFHTFLYLVRGYSPYLWACLV